MKNKRACDLVIACLALALAGCGAPFFVSEADLRNVLGKEYLYAGTGTGVLAFDIDIDTGRITSLSGPFGASCVGELAATPAGTALYALPHTASDVYGYRIEPGGTLSLLPGFPFVPTDGAAALSGARRAAVTPDGRFAHILHQNAVGAITSYAVDPDTAQLSFVGATLGLGCSPIAMTIDAGGRNLYLGLGNSSIARLDLETAMPGAMTQVGTPVGTIVRMAAHPADYLYALPQTTGDTNIYAYRIDADTGALGELSGSPYRLGFGPTNLSAVNMAVDGRSGHLYVTGNDDALYSYRIGEAGELTLLQGFGTANGGEVSPSNSGRYVFVGGDNSYGRGASTSTRSTGMARSLRSPGPPSSRPSARSTT